MKKVIMIPLANMYSKVSACPSDLSFLLWQGGFTSIIYMVRHHIIDGGHRVWAEGLVVILILAVEIGQGKDAIVNV